MKQDFTHLYGMYLLTYQSALDKTKGRIISPEICSEESDMTILSLVAEADVLPDDPIYLIHAWRIKSDSSTEKCDYTPCATLKVADATDKPIPSWEYLQSFGHNEAERKQFYETMLKVIEQVENKK